MEKDQDQYKKTIIELKGRAAKFHKFSIAFWAKTVLLAKNKQKSATVTESVDITNLEIKYYFKMLLSSSKFQID